MSPDAGPDAAASAGHLELHRTRLLETLRSSSARGVCLSAPSGFGKTTLLRQWVADDPRPSVMVRNNPYFSDARLAADQLVAGLHDVGLVDVAGPGHGVGRGVSWLIDYLPWLERSLATIDTAVLVVVDSNAQLDGPPWDALLECLLVSLPAGSSLGVATRGQCPRSLRRHRATDRLLEIDASMLAFDVMEAAALVAGLGITMETDDLLTFVERTEGWPAAIYLAALAVRDGRVPSELPPTSIDVFRDLIRDRVFDDLDDRAGEFLLLSSVLPELNGDHCSALTGADDALGLLRHLAATNRLIMPLDSTQTRFRLHPLLSDFLNDELMARSLLGWHGTHARASQIMMESGDVDAAIHHATLADDDELLSKLVWGQATPLLASGRSQVVARWIESIKPSVLRRSPYLAIVAAWVAQHRGDQAAMARWHAYAERALADREEEDARPYLDVLTASLGVDGVEEVERLTTEALTRLQDGDPYRVAALLHHGAATLMLGRPDDGLASLEECRHLCAAFGFVLVEAVALALQLNATLARDDLHAASLKLTELSHVLGRHRFENTAAAAPAFASSATGHLLKGRTDLARRDALIAQRLLSLLTGSAPWLVVQGRLQVARVLLALGETNQAAALLAEAEAEYVPASRCPANETEIRKLTAAIAQVHAGDHDPEPLTLAEIRVLQYLPTHLTFPQIAGEIGVSRSTVKTQVLAAYRKLGVHNRDEAVTIARAIGLVGVVEHEPPSLGEERDRQHHTEDEQMVDGGVGDDHVVLLHPQGAHLGSDGRASL